MGGVIPFKKVGKAIYIDKACDFCGKKPSLVTHYTYKKGETNGTPRHEFECDCDPDRPLFDTIEEAAKWWVDNSTDLIVFPRKNLKVLMKEERVMPNYIWEFICHNELDDGEYKFAEGTVTVKDGWASWKEN